MAIPNPKVYLKDIGYATLFRLFSTSRAPDDSVVAVPAVVDCGS